MHSLTQLAIPTRPSPMSSNKSHSAGLTQPVLFAKSLLSFHLIANFKPNIFSTNLISSHIILQASLSYNAHCVYPICSKCLFLQLSFAFSNKKVHKVKKKREKKVISDVTFTSLIIKDWSVSGYTAGNVWCVGVVDLSRLEILNVGAARDFQSGDGSLFPGVK